ncbi:predicted protein [Lichtheimia corymbifera JMRC:FSU:9682]|uniref:Uncharacterized protein n=1 Tax=Lichtheimia corymbifera JMRC:FSU:9682 TaxID=1263082 RepID=A0A068SFT2_9FUNG|nr:predicted protein [Lichtheimia corymbifera JMRC:FSU:9682]
MGSDRFDMVVAFHQFSFLATGICSTLGVQWLFYAGAASRWIKLFYTVVWLHWECDGWSIDPMDGITATRALSTFDLLF